MAFQKRQGPKRRRSSSSWDKGSRRPRRFAEIKAHEITYTNERMLRRFLSDRGKIVPRRISGISSKNQRLLCQAIKRARHLALLPFVNEVYK
ncbi:MAG: 30S ribosomal protein S18 [Planctomycetes bacterium]|nr:30S ribosomal protein S18 [Planctomycetota bacterium]